MHIACSRVLICLNISHILYIHIIKIGVLLPLYLRRGSFTIIFLYIFI